jgi:hypothetical protein
MSESAGGQRPIRTPPELAKPAEVDGSGLGEPDGIPSDPPAVYPALAIAEGLSIPEQRCIERYSAALDKADQNREYIRTLWKLTASGVGEMLTDSDIDQYSRTTVDLGPLNEGTVHNAEGLAGFAAASLAGLAAGTSLSLPDDVGPISEIVQGAAWGSLIAKMVEAGAGMIIQRSGKALAGAYQVQARLLDAADREAPAVENVLGRYVVDPDDLPTLAHSVSEALAGLEQSPGPGLR